VLGSPISHSLSPTLHRAAYGALGLDWTYDAYEVDEPALADFLAGLGDDWRGVSLTMPLKQAAVGLCDRVDDVAQLVGAVNTVLIEPDGELVGLNTDVPGFVAAWRADQLDRVVEGRRVRSATVLGAGATARSAIAALAELGIRRLALVLRAPEKAGPAYALAEALGMSPSVSGLSEPWSFPAVDLLVSTLPAGALESAPPPVVDRLVAQGVAVCDVVYSPRDTLLLRTARAYARPVSEGFDLLLHQAARQVELMTGCERAPLDAMRTAGSAELARRRHRDDGQPAGS
jgi:shikimate dehydrogenase